MKSKLQFLKLIGCITVVTLGAITFVNLVSRDGWILQDLLEISEDFKDHCKYNLTQRG